MLFNNDGVLNSDGFDSFGEDVPGWSDEGLDCPYQDERLRVVCEYQDKKRGYLPGWINSVTEIARSFYREYKDEQTFCTNNVCHNDAYEILCPDTNKWK